MFKAAGSIMDGQIKISFWGREGSFKGKWEGYEIEISVELIGRGLSEICICLYHPFHFQMFVSPKGLLSRIYRIYEANIPKEKISIADIQFDNNYDIWADNKLRVRDFLTPERREIIQDLLQRKNHFQFLRVDVDHMDLSKSFRTGIFGLKKHLFPTQIAEILRDMVRFIECRAL